jgi:hypothetical protein
VTNAKTLSEQLFRQGLVGPTARLSDNCRTRPLSTASLPRNRDACTDHGLPTFCKPFHSLLSFFTQCPDFSMRPIAVVLIIFFYQNHISLNYDDLVTSRLYIALHCCTTLLDLARSLAESKVVNSGVLPLGGCSREDDMCTGRNGLLRQSRLQEPKLDSVT